MKPQRYEVSVKEIKKYHTDVYTIKGTLEGIQARFMKNFNTDDYIITSIYYTNKPELQIDLSKETKEQIEKIQDKISTINAKILHKKSKKLQKTEK